MFAGRVTKTLRQSAPRLVASFSSKPPPAPATTSATTSATQELFRTVNETAAKLQEEVQVSAPTGPVPFRSSSHPVD